MHDECPCTSRRAELPLYLQYERYNLDDAEFREERRAVSDGRQEKPLLLSLSVPGTAVDGTTESTTSQEVTPASAVFTFYDKYTGTLRLRGREL